MSKISYTRLSLMAATAAAAVVMQSCLSDDGIPYPNIQANFTSLTVDCQARPARIDSINRKVSVYLNDSADIQAVKVKAYTLNRPDAALVDPAEFDRPLNLADSLNVALKVYREYIWTISAIQTIERRFAVEGQIGQAVIDPETRTVTASVPSDLPLTDVVVTDIKLGAATSTVTPDLLGHRTDFTDPVTVTVDEFGRKSQWTIRITQTDINVRISDIDAWTGVAWVHAAIEQGASVTIQFRQAGTMQWTDVPSADVAINGAAVTARISGLNPATDYEARAVSGDEATAPAAFRTGLATQLPNSGFTQWWLDGKVWCPWGQDDTSFWDTGNKGASTLGESNVTPIDSESSLTGYAGARLQTRFIGISVIGKLGAGSIFTGRYVRTDGTNGILAFGREFTERPTKLRARVRYKNVPIDYASSDFPELKGRPDTCTIWCALSDATEPYEIRTNPKNRQLFDPEAPTVIAYGNFDSGNPIAEFTTIEIPLLYNATNRRPTMIVVVCAASKYGDYFTGGSGSTLEVESVELVYD